MKEDYIVIGGKQYRVEANWNALSVFLKEVGRDTIDGLISFKNLHPSEMPVLMAACIAEGERLDGREFTMKALDLGAIIKIDDVNAFLDIYVRQSEPQREVEAPKKAEREEEPAR